MWRYIYSGSGFSLTPHLESFTLFFGLRTPVFQRIFLSLRYGTPTFSKLCLLDSYFLNPSENPEVYLILSCLQMHVFSLPFSQMEPTIVTSCLLPWTTQPFQMGSKFFPFRADHTEMVNKNGNDRAAFPESLNLLYTDGVFHCYMLEESNCHFGGVGSISPLLFYF